MKVRPIIFSGPMVRALLEGRKSQTRRILKPQPDLPPHFRPPIGFSAMCPSRHYEMRGWTEEKGPLMRHRPLPYWNGDLLYVRENWAARLDEDHIRPKDLRRREVFYWADGPGRCCNTGCAGAAGKVRPSIHMPRRYSRLTLEVTSVKVERLQDISEDDAKAEGMAFFDHGVDRYGRQSPGWHWDAFEIAKGADYCLDTARFAFGNLWEHLNHKRAPWASNPFVVAVSFNVIHRNVDAVLAQREAA